MTKLIASIILASTLILSGCQSNPIIDPSSDDKGVDGYSVSVDNYNKISDKNINLKFAVNPMGESEEFPWAEVEADVIEILKKKGIKLSSEGRLVTVTLEKFVAHGSDTAFRKTSRGSNLGGIVGSLGGSVLQAIAVHEVDRKIAKDSIERVNGDGKNFVPEIGFKVESTNFEANVNLHNDEAIYSYVSSTVWITRQAISEDFTPTK